MTTLDDLMSVGDERRDKTREVARQAAGYTRVGVWAVGWALAKLLVLLMACVAGLFYGIGWVAARTVPVLRWLKTAFALGWEQGRSASAR
jgi:hypothetical protein